MSLQIRLSLMVGTLFAATLAALIAAVALDASPRLRSENDSIMNLTQAIVQSTLATLEHAPDPASAMKQLVRRLSTLRHVEVFLLNEKSANSSAQEATNAGVWGRIGSAEAFQTLQIPVVVSGKTIDTIVLKPKPSDELSEVRDAIKRIAQFSLALGAMVIALVTVLIGRLVRPLDSLAHAIGQMEEGDFSVKLDGKVTPEITVIRDRLNRLASALRKSTAENKRLSQHLLRLQDQERREVARDLHDELGPYLFSLRAAAAALQAELRRPTCDIARAEAVAAQLVSHVEAVQKTNRRVLNRLSPMGFDELGLKGALAALGVFWNKERPHVRTAVTIDGNYDDADETTQLTIFRVVQEGLTNAHRHSGGTSVLAHVDRCAAVTNEQDGASDRAVLTVTDNGSGLKGPRRYGFGLTAMRERVVALGGSMDLSDGPDGVVLHASLPLAGRTSGDSCGVAP